MNILPILISIPHGGTVVPEEVKDRLILTKEELFDDGDAFTNEIYNRGDQVSAVISASIARAFVDLNRAPDDLPPRNPDGVIKSHTCYGKVIYKKGLEPDKLLRSELLEKYYFPYHQQIQRIIEDKNSSIKLALDCHSMAAIAPPISPDEGENRPMICIGNVFGKSCPKELIENMADCFRKGFSLKDHEVSLNRPFAGGYITQNYGRASIPWIQIEINRKLYLQAPYFDRNKLKVKKSRVQELGQMFEEVQRLFFK